MTIANIMTRNVAQIAPTLSLSLAAEMMEQKRISSLLVVEDGQHVGILTERDMVRGIASGVETSQPVSVLMSAPLRSVPHTISKMDAYHTLAKHGIRHLLVVNAAGQAQGIVSESDFRMHGNIERFVQLRDVASTMSTNIAMLNAQASVADAARLMAQHKVDHVLVGTDGRAAGIVTERDIVRLFRQNDHARSLEKVMSSPVATIPRDAPLQEAARRMNEERIRRLVVVDDAGLVLGVLTEHDIVKHIEEGYVEMLLGIIKNQAGELAHIQHELLNNALRRKTKLYAALSQGNSALVHIQDAQKLLEKVCEVVLNFGGFRLAWVGRENAEQKILPVAFFGDARDYILDSEFNTDPNLPTGQGPTGTAIRENRTVVVNDYLTSPTTTPWHAAAEHYGLRGSISLPIMAHDFRGVLVVYADTVNYFDDEVIGLLQELSGDIAYALKQIHVNTVREKQNLQLKLADQVFASSAEAMMITDANNDIIRINQAFTEITGYTPEEVTGKNPRILKSNKQDADFYRTLWRHLLLQGSWQGELWNRRKNGEIFPEWTSINVVKDASGKVVNHFAVFSDLLQKKAVEELDHLKHFDPLTDLPNRTLLEDRIDSAITHAQQHDRFIGVIFLNLDHFHTVNDLFGHPGGDQMLIVTAQRLVEAVPPHATVTRLSADTFVIALPDLNTSEEINRIAELIAHKVYQTFTVGDQQVQLSARMGIAVYPLDGEDTNTLMKCADSALADAKKSGGRNSFRFYSSSMNEHARKLVTMGAELRTAIEQNRLVLHYQPQVDIVSGAIIGAEALIRINHPQRGVIPPGEFIAVAEETGLIVPMGEWVIREACRQMQQWNKEAQTELTVAVNLSPLQLHQSNLATIVKNALDESGLAARFLELEFTESAIMHNVRDTIEIMERFKAMGLHLSIDDFGTGYSSLSYLKQFPVDKLKIDQSFVSNITQDPNDAAIVQAIIALGKTLGLTTIAEGVETEAQLGFLRSVHCKEMQGYLFSRPLPAAEFAALLAQGKSLGNNQSEKILLLVDDEENVLMSLKRILRREGYKVLTASSAEEGLEVMGQYEVNVVLSDQRMPGMSGVEFLRRVKTMHPDVVRMILSGYTEIGTLTDAINKGEIYQFITKPWENEALIALIREAFVRHDILKRSLD